MNPITKWSIAVGAVLLVPTVAHAQADEKAACDEPYDAWQVASKERHFLEAREKLKLCARASCGENMAADCTKELAKLEDRIPAIIMRAEELGQPLDAAVQLDGKPLVDHLDGRSVDIDPGSHVFTFLLADGRKTDLSITVSESDRTQKVRAVFEPRRVQAETPPGGPETPPSSQRSSLRTVGWVAGGVGVVGLALGAIFGVKASHDKGSANCDDKNQCDSAPLADARSAATLSTVSFVAGGVLLAGGLGLVLFAPSGGSSGASATGMIHVTPSLGRNAGSLTLTGRF